jgi:hypothetical protein
VVRRRIPWTCRGCGVELTKPNGSEIEVIETAGLSGGAYEPYTRVRLDGRYVHDCADPSVVPVEFTFEDSLGGYPARQFDPVDAPFATTSDTRFARRWRTEDEVVDAAKQANLGPIQVIAVPFQ